MNALLPLPPAAHAYTAQEKVLFGRPAGEALAEELGRLRARRVFVVTGRTLAGTAHFRALVDSLSQRCAGVYTGVRAFAPRECVVEGAQAARSADADLLLAVGGGSVIDAAKVMLLCLRYGLGEADQLDAHADASWDATQVRPPDAEQWLRIVAVPTTFSAAEYTARGGATRGDQRLQEAFSAPLMIPQSVVNAPEMTLATPLRLLLSTGMKAVDHAVERLTSRYANAYSDMVSTMALRYLAEALPALRSRPDELEVRARLQYGTFLSMAGRASGVQAGLSHAIAHQLGTWSGVPHGETSCVLMAAVVRWIGDARPGGQQLLCEALGSGQQDAGAALLAFVGGLGLPTRLRDVGVREDDLQVIAERTMRDPLIRNCPREVRGPPDVREVLALAW